MKWLDFIPSSEKLNLIQGVEANLLKQKKARDTYGISLMIVGVLIQIMTYALDRVSSEQIFENTANFFRFLYGLFPGVEPSAVYQPAYEMVGIFILLAGIGFWFISRHTRLLVRETEEPFRYTFWIETFTNIGEEGLSNKSESKGDDKKPTEFANPERFALLRHDLIERLNKRIGRLSLLDLSKIGKQNGENDGLSAHIHIEGHYAIREKKKNEWVIQVMPRVRIGPEDQPSTLSFPIKFPVEKDEVHLNSDRYNQLVERVYSSVATEIYAQIERDVKQKMKLFPTNYLRAIAYFNEAEDFVRSNTVDAYDHAIELYREAIRYFNISKSKWLTDRMLQIPVLWRFCVKRIHFRSRFYAGYAKCLIYRRVISTLSGRSANPIFELPPLLNKVISELDLIQTRMDPLRRKEKNYFLTYLAYPKDSPARYFFRISSETLFQKQRSIQFEVHVVTALAYYFLGAAKKPIEYLEKAKAADPPQAEKNSLYLLTKGVLHPELDHAIHLIRKAAERSPDFQIAQYLLANWSEMRLRMQNDISESRIKRVINKYNRVLEINPGNVAALAAEGYLYWLIKDFEKAKEKFLEGIELKEIISETFVGPLNYGLARIAAEEGKFEESFDLYHQAISADPNVGAIRTLTAKQEIIDCYDYIGPDILKRYHDFKENVQQNLQMTTDTEQEEWDKTGLKNTSEKIKRTVHSYVLNDYATACQYYYYRFNDSLAFDASVEAYERALEEDPDNIIARFNVHFLYRINNQVNAETVLEEVVEKNTSWQEAVLSLALYLVRDKEQYISEKSVSDSKKVISEGSSESDVELKNEKTGSKATADENKASVGESTPGSTQIYSYRPAKTIDVKIEEQIFTMLDHTKWSALPESMKSGKNFHKLLSDPKINWEDRINDFDALTLFVWAQIELKKGLETSQVNKILTFLEHLQDKYFPEHFDLNKDLIQAFDQILSNGSDPLIQQKKSKSVESIKYMLTYWLARDPVQFTNLNDIIHYFEDDEHDDFVIDALEKACRLNEKLKIGDLNHHYYNSLGNRFYRNSNFNQAVIYYKEAIELNPEQAIYHRNLGGAYGGLKNWERMIKHCKDAIQFRMKFPDHYELAFYYEYLCEAYFYAERMDAIEAELLKKNSGLSDSDKARIFNRTGNLFYNNEDYQHSKIYYQKAIQHNINQPIYHRNLAGAYKGLGEWDSMIEHSRKAMLLRLIQTDDEYELVYYIEYLADACFGAQKLNEFESEFRVAEDELNHKEMARIFNRIGNLFFNISDFSNAIVYYEKAIGYDTDSPIYFCNLGRAFGNNYDLDSMIFHCQKAVVLRKNRPTDAYDLYYYYNFLVYAYHKVNKLKELEKALENIKNELGSNDSARLYNRIGNLYFENSEFLDAITYYQRAITLDSKSPIFYCNLGRTHGNLDDWKTMYEHCEKAVHYRKKVVYDEYELDYYYEFFAEAAFKTGRMFEFNTKITDDKERFSSAGLARLYNRIGNLCYGASDYSRSVKYYQRAIVSDGQKPVFFSNIGRAYGELGDWDSMFNYCSKAVELRRQIDDDDYELMYYYEFLADAAIKSNNADMFIINLKVESILTMNQKARILNITGNHYFAAADYTKAIECYKEAITCDGITQVYQDNLDLATQRLKQPPQLENE